MQLHGKVLPRNYPGKSAPSRLCPWPSAPVVRGLLVAEALPWASDEMGEPEATVAGQASGEPQGVACLSRAAGVVCCTPGKSLAPAPWLVCSCWCARTQEWV